MPYELIQLNLIIFLIGAAIMSVVWYKSIPYFKAIKTKKVVVNPFLRLAPRVYYHAEGLEAQLTSLFLISCNLFMSLLFTTFLTSTPWEYIPFIFGGWLLIVIPIGIAHLKCKPKGKWGDHY